jgi:multiple sugar transport system permease protein
MTAPSTLDIVTADGRRGGRRVPASVSFRRQLIPWLFLVPGLVLALVFKFLPMFDGIRMSFLKVQPFLGDEFVGWANYATVLGDKRFIESIGNTVTIAVFQTIGAVVVAFLLALLMEGSARWLRWTRTAVFLPVVTALAIIGEVWRILLFPSEAGFANRVIGFFGIPPQDFLSDPNQAIWWVVVVGIDRTLYEASAMDGVSTWQRLRHIVIPSMRSSFAVVLTLAAIRALRVFTEVYVLTGGGPAGSTEVWMTRTFSLGFDQYKLGVASAASVILLVVTLVLTVGVQWITRRKGNN